MFISLTDFFFYICSFQFNEIKSRVTTIIHMPQPSLAPAYIIVYHWSQRLRASEKQKHI